MKTIKQVIFGIVLSVVMATPMMGAMPKKKPLISKEIVEAVNQNVCCIQTVQEEIDTATRNIFTKEMLKIIVLFLVGDLKHTKELDKQIISAINQRTVGKDRFSTYIDTAINTTLPFKSKLPQDLITIITSYAYNPQLVEEANLLYSLFSRVKGFVAQNKVLEQKDHDAHGNSMVHLIFLAKNYKELATGLSKIAKQDLIDLNAGSSPLYDALESATNHNSTSPVIEILEKNPTINLNGNLNLDGRTPQGIAQLTHDDNFDLYALGFQKHPVLGVALTEILLCEGPQEIIGLLLQHSAKYNNQIMIDCKNEVGRTPLQVIASYYYTEDKHTLLQTLLQTLLEYDANPNTRKDRWVASYNHAPIMRHLEIKKPQRYKKEEFGWTPLHTAAFRGNDKAVEMLLAYGADVNARTNDNELADELSDAYANEFVINSLHEQCKKLIQAKRSKLDNKDQQK